MNEEHGIPLSTAAEMTALYRQNRNTILGENYKDMDLLAICETFTADAIKEILGQPDCVSFRIYFGMDEELKVHSILVGADSSGKDILPSASSQNISETYTDIIMEKGTRCPVDCPPASDLNGG
jgi:hypothetical protein